ncbi:hypothetical protein JW887_06755 [Candidatus Dojkabacteria bacterium]|nr:hypothetical protein [Candidatus Dojkabacteria bacterium]
MNFFKNCIIPNYLNSYYPLLLRKPFLVFITIVFVSVNVFSDTIGLNTFASSITEDNIIELTNEERLSHDLPPLELNSMLTAAAYAKANDIFEKQYWSHYGPDGETPWDFILSSGYDYIYAGENLAKGFNTAEGVVNAWMASQTHKDNILNLNYNEIGVAVVRGDLLGSDVILVVQIFGATLENYSPSYLPTSSSSSDGSISIDFPESGEVIPDYDFDVSGSVDGNSTSIEIYDNQKFIGETIGEDGVWSYRPDGGWSNGEHNVEVIDSDTNNSDTSIFSVDYSAPEVEDVAYNWVTSNSVFNSVKVECSISGDPSIVRLMIDDYSEDMSNDGLTYYVNVRPLKISKDSIIKIVAIDEVGNRSEKNISKDFLSFYGQNVPSAVSFLGNIGLSSVTDVFNFVVVIGFSVVIFIDAFYLFRLNIFQTRGKTIFPMGIWLLAVIISMLVSSSGVIV